MNNSVLVIDDDLDLLKLVEVTLRAEGLSVTGARDGMEGLKKAYEFHPDLIILDVMMPGMNGFEVGRRLRELSDVPILMLSALTSDSDLLHGFQIGVNDYLKKPFSALELQVRVRSLINHNTHNDKNDPAVVTLYEDEILEVDLQERAVFLRGRKLEVSSTEFNVLACLIQRQSSIVPQREILREVWGESLVSSYSTIPFYICCLRKKIEDGNFGHQYIRTQWGRGYMFSPRNGGNGRNNN